MQALASVLVLATGVGPAAVAAVYTFLVTYCLAKGNHGRAFTLDVVSNFITAGQ